MFTIENELSLLEKYKLTPTELFAIKVILLAKEEGEYECLQRFVKILKFRDVLISLQNKGIILKSFKIGIEGSSLDVEEIPINQNFQKQFYRASLEMGKELFDTYPQFLTINGVLYNARRISKKFNSLEEAFAKYAKTIKYNPETHQEIIENIKWGIENKYNFTTLDDFISDCAYLALKAYKEGNGININCEAIRMI